MILVTAGFGNQGKLLVPKLLAAGQRVRACVQSESSAQSLRALGVHDVVVGDISEPATMTRAVRGADFYEPLDLKKEYAQLDVRGVERVNDRDAYVVVARPQGDLTERLYFDTQTGLLVRKWTVVPTPTTTSEALNLIISGSVPRPRDALSTNP